MANAGRKLALALDTASEITAKVWDLRVLMARMSDRQKDLFTHLIKGYSELETLLLAGRMGEIAGVIPVVTSINGEAIKTTALKSLSDLKTLDTDSLAALDKLAKDHIQASIGSFNYKEPLSDINWFFRMIAPQAAQVVTEIMDDKKVAAQTRLTAANSLLDRAGYSKREESRGELPVRVILNVPPQPQIIEGEALQS